MIEEITRESTSSLHDIYNFQFVTPSIASAGQPEEIHLSAIALAGYDMVVNLGIENSAYGIPQEQDVVNRLLMQYENIPVAWDSPRLSDFDYFCLLMLQHRRKRIFVHCAANKRASVFIALYRFLVLGVAKEQAFRPMFAIWTPNAVWSQFIDHVVMSHFTRYEAGTM
jgi:protein tyrosine phosphatase (PTP) superfamily phosphohydrolase (DUF442 family)